MSMQSMRKLYDSFEVKDMSFDAFVAAHTILTRPPTPQEIMGVQMKKAREDSQRINANRKSSLILPN